MSGTILLADDEEKILKTLGRALRDEGFDVVTTPNAREASRLLAERAFDLLIVDYLMPEKTGLDVIREAVGATPEGERPAMVIMTAHGSIESAVEAMKLGARDYLQKPFEVDELLAIARRAIEDQRARLGLRYLLDERDVEFGHYGIVGNSRAVRELLARAEREGFRPTDDAALWERWVGPVALVPGSPANLKITRPEDLEIARAIARSREKEP